MRSVIDLSDPEASYSGSAVLGVGVPLFIGARLPGARRRADGACWRLAGPQGYFERRPFEALPPDFVPGAAAPELAETPAGKPDGAPASCSASTTPTARARALAVAIEVARRLGEPLHVAFGAAPPTHGGGGGARAPPRAGGDRRRAAGRGAGGRRARPACEVESHLVAERPVDLLMRPGREHDARMIVVGSYGESPLRGAILGSTPHKLLHLSRPARAGCVPS